MKEINYNEIARMEEALGFTYFKNFEYQKAIEYYLKSEIIYKKLYGETNAFVGNNNTQVGKIYLLLANYSFSIEYFVRALRVCGLLYGDNCIYYADICCNLGQVNGKINNTNVALEYFKKAEDILKNNSPRDSLLNLYSEFFEVYLREKQYDQAYEYSQMSLKISECNKMNDPYKYLQSLEMIFKFHNYKNQFTMVY